MFNVLDRLITITYYLGIFTGLWLITFPLIVPNIKRNINYSKTKDFKNNKGKPSEFSRHIRRLLAVSWDLKGKFAEWTFYAITVSIFITMMIVFKNTEIRINIRLMSSIVLSLVPYLFLRIKLYNNRIEVSYEGERFVTEFTNQYKINYLNMSEAIDKTVHSLKDCPKSKKMIKRLGIGIKEYKTNDELEELIQDFNYELNTQWGMLLSNNIHLSIAYGDDVREALNDVIEDIKDIKRILEKNKQQNHESFIMIRFIAPIAYILTVLFAIKYFNFTIGKFISYQFKTDMGLKFFILSILSMIVNYGIYIVVKKPKYDY